MITNGITYAIIVAVEEYNQPNHFSKIRYAEKDATEILNSLVNIGVNEEDIVLLINKASTKTAIEQELRNVSRKATKYDRIIFFFTGHGAFESKENYLLPVDCYNNNIQQTSVSITYVLGNLKKSECRRNILFLDCCHSGFEPGDNTKGVDKTFNADELIYDYRDEVYTVGFASCQSHQVSITHPQLTGSVWTHFLIEALNGKAGTIYKEGILFSDALQEYLTHKTREFVKQNTSDKKEQVPIIFGNMTDKFIVANLNPIFATIEAEKKATSMQLSSITIFDTYEGYIKDLPGFTKKFHKEPSSISNTVDNFVKDISGNIVYRDVENLSAELKTHFRYTRKELNVEIEKGYALITTPDFQYRVEVSQSPTKVREYVITRMLNEIYTPNIIRDERFNKVFEKYFRQLSFTFSKKIDVEEFIDKAEEIAKTGVFEVEYNPADTSICYLIFPNTQNEVVVTESSINITTPRAISPSELLDVYKETSLRLEEAKVNLLT